MIKKNGSVHIKNVLQFWYKCTAYSEFCNESIILQLLLGFVNLEEFSELILNATQIEVLFAIVLVINFVGRCNTMADNCDEFGTVHITPV